MSEIVTAARPYAKAVFEIAKKSNSFDAWADRLKFLAAVVRDDKVAAVLDQPNSTAAQRAELVQGIAGDRLDADGANMVRLLAENGRLGLLDSISDLYDDYRALDEGVLEANVVSAQALDDTYKARLAEALEKKFNKKINIVNTVDESLIGGALIRAGDVVIDGSVKGKLQQLGQSLSA